MTKILRRTKVRNNSEKEKESEEAHQFYAAERKLFFKANYADKTVAERNALLMAEFNALDPTEKERFIQEHLKDLERVKKYNSLLDRAIEALNRGETLDETEYREVLQKKSKKIKKMVKFDEIIND